MHGYKWPINCTRTRVQPTQRGPSTTTHTTKKPRKAAAAKKQAPTTKKQARMCMELEQDPAPALVAVPAHHRKKLDSFSRLLPDFAKAGTKRSVFSLVYYGLFPDNP